MRSDDKVSTGILEITDIPRRYVEDSQKLTPDRANMHNLRMDRFLGTVLHSKVPFGFRITTNNRRARFLYATKKPEATRAAFIAQFPDFEIHAVNDYSKPAVNNDIIAMQITGIPKQSVHHLNALVETMIRSDSIGIYQVTTISKKPSMGRRYLAKKKYSSALQNAQQQESFQTWLGGQQTRTRVDAGAMHASERHEALYKRMNADLLLRCQVTLAFWSGSNDEETLETAINSLMATISLEDRYSRLKTRYLTGSRAMAALERAFRLEIKGKSTDLLPAEAIPYFDIPSIEVGMKMTSPASYSTFGTRSHSPIPSDRPTAPFRPRCIGLGYTYRSGIINTSQVKFIPLEYLRRHTLITGMTGSGKSSTKNHIVIDAWKNGIATLLIEPVKADARTLLGPIPEVRVFTVGRETICPFRLNPFLIEEGFPVQAHIDLLHSCFVAAWPLYGILSNHMRRLLVRTYISHGWDPVFDIRGRPISLESFYHEAVKFSRTLGYGSELSQDFEGAILNRVKDLSDPSRAVILNTPTNLPIAELFSRPTILELKHIQDPEFRALMLNLILVRIWMYFDRLGPSKKLRNLISIDEAHRFIAELPPVVDMSEMAASKRQALDQIVDMVAESRSAGVGFVISDQSLSRLASDIRKNSHTKIMHRHESPEELQLAALETSCNEEQARHISNLKEGEAVVRTLNDNVPLNLQIIHDPSFIPEMDRVWTDDDIREHMKQFYVDNPQYAKTPEIPDLESYVPDTETTKSLNELVDEIVRTPTFCKLYLDALEETGRNPESNQVERLVAHYAVHLSHYPGTPDEIAYELVELALTVHGEPVTPVSFSLIREYMEDAEQKSEKCE